MTSGNARPALAVIPHGNGACPPCVATTSTAVCRGCRLDSALSLPFPALVWDAGIDLVASFTLFQGKGRQVSCHHVTSECVCVFIRQRRRSGGHDSCKTFKVS